SYVHPSYPAAGIWILGRRGVPAARWTDLPSWLLRRVLGVEVGWSSEIAAGSGLWHQDDGDWDPRVLAAMGLDHRTLGAPWTTPVEIPTGPLAGALLVPTFADGMCHNVGLGATGPSASALAVGTSASMRLLLGPDAGPVGGPDAGRVAEPVIHPDAGPLPWGLWRYRGGGRVAVGASSSAAGNVVAWAGALG